MKSVILKKHYTGSNGVFDWGLRVRTGEERSVVHPSLVRQ